MTERSLTDLQVSVMNVVWEAGDVTVVDVVSRLAQQGRELAPTTVATLLQRLASQGWLKSRKVGRVLHYSALVERRAAARGALRQLLTGFFGGSAANLTAHLIDEEMVSPEDLEEMKRLVEEQGD